MKAHHYKVFMLFAVFSAVGTGKARSRTIVIDFDTTPPAGKLSVTEIPKKPRSFVIDEPAGFSSVQKSELENALAGMHSAPTYIVIKKGRLPVSPKLYGNELLRRWTASEARFSSLVLRIDTPNPEIFIIIAGRNLDAVTKNDLLELGNAALKLIDNQPDQFGNIRRISTALSPALNTYASLYQAPSTLSLPDATQDKLPSIVPEKAGSLTGQTVPPSYGQKTTSHWDLLSTKLDWRLIRVLFIIICAILSMAVIIILLRRIRRHRPLYFPLHKPRHRFSAPYSGGSNAQIKYVGE